MPAQERAFHRGRLRGRRLIDELGRELRSARLDRGLSLRALAPAAGVSASKVSRIERGLVGSVGLIELATLLQLVGLELSARAYPAGQPLRDAAHLSLLGRFATGLHRTLRWQTEVPLPSPGDQRAWDGLVQGRGWRYGVEAETAPRDVQALHRRLLLKARDGAVDGVLLLLPTGRRTTTFLRAAPDLRSGFPVEGRRALELLGAGADPGGSAIIVLARQRI